MAIDVLVQVRDYDDYAHCGICGAMRGEPCKITRAEGKGSRRSEPHFYRGRTSPPERQEPT